MLTTHTTPDKNLKQPEDTPQMPTTSKPEATSIANNSKPPKAIKPKKKPPVLTMAKVTGQPGAYNHNEILAKLLSEIAPIDFINLIRPTYKLLKEEFSNIEDAFSRGDVDLYNKLNNPKGTEEYTRAAELIQELKKIEKSVRQKHYIVCIINELLKIADERRWNLCKRYDYVYVYNGAYWKQLGKDDLKGFLGNAAIKMGYPEIEAKYQLFKDELLKQYIAEAHLPAPEQDSESICINLQNGTFVFKHGRQLFQEFDPKDFLTYQLPFKFDPAASCPLFRAYLDRVLPDIDCQMILQEFAGFIFTKMNLEKCLVLTGGGQNGKSVFFNVLTALIGSNNTLTYSLGQFNHEYNRAKLTDVLLNYSSEKGFDLSVDTFKALVSGEPLQAREPYGKPFTINNKVKFILNCNELPKETESTDAYFRRFLIIPFDVKITEAEKDINLADKIINTELAGIFNWLLEGLQRLIENQKFTTSEKVNRALADFKKQADSVALFVDDRCYKPSPLKKLSLVELYGDYKSFCSDDGYRHAGKNKFSKKLEHMGFEPTRLNDGGKGFLIEKSVPGIDLDPSGLF